MLYAEIGIVVALICVNGLLAMSELAIVSARPARLKAMIENGKPVPAYVLVPLTFQLS